MHAVDIARAAIVARCVAARTPGLGSAIFLHVDTGGSTAGCVSLPQSELVTILTWLNPADNPAIQITGA